MHEPSLIKDMLKVAEEARRGRGAGRIEKICVELSEFGGMDEGHFRFHFDEATRGSAWEGVGLEIARVPVGPEARLVSVSFREAQS